MFKHNFLLIYRNFRRFKSTFFINLIGLSIGITCTLLIYLWVSDEMNVDKFHENDSQLFQIMENSQLADRITTRGATPDLLAETMADEIPEIEYVAAVTPSEWFSFKIAVNEKNMKAAGEFAGKDFFNVFSYDLIQGSGHNVLAGNKNIVITEGLANKLFNTTDNIIGKTIGWQLLNFKNEAVVSGICKDPPANSSMQFEFVLPLQTWLDISKEIGRGVNWGNHGPSTYAVLKKEQTLKTLIKK